MHLSKHELWRKAIYAQQPSLGQVGEHEQSPFIPLLKVSWSWVDGSENSRTNNYFSTRSKGTPGPPLAPASMPPLGLCHRETGRKTGWDASCSKERKLQKSGGLDRSCSKGQKCPRSGGCSPFLQLPHELCRVPEASSMAPGRSQ